MFPNSYVALTSVIRHWLVQLLCIGLKSRYVAVYGE